MKKYIAIMMGLALLTGASSCTKMTDLQPVSDVSPNQFWQDANQVSSFVTGLHIRFRSQNGNMMFLGELRSGEFGNEPGDSGAFTGEASQGLETMWNQTLTLDNPGVADYGTFYQNINQINLLISKLATITFVPDADKKYYLGVAYGMRAYYYFQIYKSWGNAVIQTEPTTAIDIANLAKDPSPAADVLKQVQADIDMSNTSFGTDYSFRQNKGFWSKAASLMLKAEVYLWTAHRTGGAADATIAKAALTEIQTNIPALALDASYKDVFATKGNSEIIFACRNVLNEATMTYLPLSFTAQTGIIVNYYKADGTKFNATTDNWSGILRAPLRIATFNQFDTKDSRQLATVVPAYSKNATTGALAIAGCFLGKYVGEQNAGSRVFTNDYIIYRYADLLLMMAEAKVILGESPAAEMNAVRQRAFGANYVAATMGYLAQAVDADPNTAILKERLLEFIGEGKRWSDLRRFGDSYVYANTSITAANSYLLLWPVDRATLTNNSKLVQTTGYKNF